MHQRFTLLATVAVALSVVPVSRAQTPVPNVDLISNWQAPLYWQPSVRDSEADINKGRIRESGVRMAAAGSAPVAPAIFVAQTPCRVLDTRASIVPPMPSGFGPPSFSAGLIRTIAIRSGPCAVGVNPNAVAYSVNIAVVPIPAGNPMHFLTAWDTGSPQPNAATLNDRAGLVTSNSAVVPAGADGSINIYVTDATDVIVDINGYYQSSDSRSNTAIGLSALSQITSGQNNTAIGSSALAFNLTGGNNTAIGYDALAGVTSGSNNFGIGNAAGSAHDANGDWNVFIANTGVAGDTHLIRIGDTHQNATFISGISGVGVSGPQVCVASTGQLGTCPSSIRFKQDIQDMGDTTDTIMSLHPVQFHYKADGPDSPMQYGLIAEDVAEVSPDLVERDSKGQIFTVRYEKVNAMVLNQVQEQQRLIEKQNTLIQQLESRIAELEKRDQ